MRISSHRHTRHPWRVFSLVRDFQLQDVWQFPIEDRGDPETAFTQFQDTFASAMERLSKKGPAGWLFQLRTLLGRLFGWDGDRSAAPALGKQSLRMRYLGEGNDQSQAAGMAVDSEGNNGFFPVYRLPRESLSEIANKTVHAALHLSWPEIESGRYTAHMAVYVKATGRFTPIYMALIKPFRHWIVYPAMMRITARMWRETAKG